MPRFRFHCQFCGMVCHADPSAKPAAPSGRFARFFGWFKRREEEPPEGHIVVKCEGCGRPNTVPLRKAKGSG